ncbi:hypothetical protein ACOSP7_003132 [Xanthoceras sorbifolium]
MKNVRIGMEMYCDILYDMYCGIVVFKRTSARTVTVAKVVDDQEEHMKDVGGVKSTFLVQKDLLEYECETEKREEKTKKHRNELEKHCEELEAAKKKA